MEWIQGITIKVPCSIEELDGMLANDSDLFIEHDKWIRDVLNQPSDMLKNELQAMLASLVLGETQIKLALSGVHLKEPVRMVFVSAPPHGLEPRTLWLTAVSEPSTAPDPPRNTPNCVTITGLFVFQGRGVHRMAC